MPAIHWPVKYTKSAFKAKDSKSMIEFTKLEPLMDVPRWGVLSAIDLVSGKIKWQNKVKQPLVGGLLSTSGNIVFVGEGNGNFNAYKASTGELLWQDHLDAGVNAPPITYMINDVQYIAVAVGGNQIFGYKKGDMLQIYKLK